MDHTLTFDKPEPLPCPFCGRSDIEVKKELLEINFTSGNVVRLYPLCNYCGATGPRKVTYDGNDFANHTIAIARWNKRGGLANE